MMARHGVVVMVISIMRAGTELGIQTVGIFSFEDRFTQHRYKADQAFLVGKGKSPVGAYLDIDSIIQVCGYRGRQAGGRVEQPLGRGP